MNLVKFKSSVLAQQCENIGEQVLNYQKYIDPIGLVISNRGGWQSRFDMSGGAPTFPLYDTWSNYLFELLQTSYADYVEKFYEKQIMVERVEQSWNTRAWFNINWPGDYNREHMHLPPDTPTDEFFYVPAEIKNDREFWLPQASGSFYVTDSHNTFYFSKNSTLGTTEEKEREYIDFNAGELWMGNSGLIHGVGKNKQNVPRITISYNIEPTVDCEFK